MPGDDLRRVDWKVWAKQDRLYVKQYEEDTNLRCCLLVDVSASMAYGSGPLTKCDYAVTAAAALAYLLLRQQDAVGCAVFDEGIRQTIPLRTSTSHLKTIVRALEHERPRDKTKLYDVLARVGRNLSAPRHDDSHFRSAGRRRTTCCAACGCCGNWGTTCCVLHVLDDDELDFPFARPARFEGLETDDHLTCNPRALREGYLAGARTVSWTTVRHGCARQHRLRADPHEHAARRGPDRVFEPSAKKEDGDS